MNPPKIVSTIRSRLVLCKLMLSECYQSTANQIEMKFDLI
jgi:hypothetical protein